jgi:uncharacterized protein (DUF2141 family)
MDSYTFASETFMRRSAHRAVIILTSALVAAGFVRAGPAEGADDVATLHVVVTGFRESAGRLALAVFDSEESYEAREPAVTKAFVPVIGGVSRWDASLPRAHRYVVLAYHDENGNGELDMRRFFGIPKEPVGISNNARAPFGPPTFEAASFMLTEGRTIEIELQ